VRILYNSDEDNDQSVYKMLQCLTYSARSLYLDELVDAVTIDLGQQPRFNPRRRCPDMHDLLQPCSSLVSITETIQIDTPLMTWLVERGPTYRKFIGMDTPESRISAQVGLDDAAWNSNPHVRLACFSVKEYLVSKRIQSGRAKLYSLEEVDANSTIADECLAYLLQNDRTDSSSLRPLRDYTLAPYAASNWFKHVAFAGEGTRRIAALSKELLTENKDAMTNWLRLYCPDYPSQRCLLHDDYPRLRVETPLYYASIPGLSELLKSLIAEGFDVNADSAHKDNQDSWGTAICAAIWAGHEQVIQSLLQAGAFFKPSGEKLLGTASLWGRADVIRPLLDLGVDVLLEASGMR